MSLFVESEVITKPKFSEKGVLCISTSKCMCTGIHMVENDEKHSKITYFPHARFG